jgi:hypothetical protein
MREARAAIGRLLQTEYVPVLTEPLPNELKHLIAQLVAREVHSEGPLASCGRERRHSLSASHYCRISVS